ncbi:YnfU family zinc-binding protein [Buttiauxella sp. B2]|uniref:YnfU family zinc-binding protein n=1 Tax=Buttiauxella sp. B2 TaxID=2587812 RepID=UPI001CB9CF05|nr:YnfU family zinc-binding protein [Buttiauxella sp. B2]
MSLFDSAMKYLSKASSNSITCPICGKKSTHPANKVRQGQTLLCPSCKSLFVAPR